MKLKDIHPRSPVAALRREFDRAELEARFDSDLVCSLVGMNTNFVRKVLGSPSGDGISLTQVLQLLDQDAYAETFVPRSMIPGYLLSRAGQPRSEDSITKVTLGNHQLIQGNSADLVAALPEETVDCVVTSTPYWGTRIYERNFNHRWADGEECALGNEQTPEGFIRHSMEILFSLKKALAHTGSVFWNLMDVFNTRTQIRSNASETLNAMRGNEKRSWSQYPCRRYSAGHSFLKDGEQCGIPGQLTTRLSRIGYYVKSLISWKKNGSLPETVESRATREVEYIIHLSKVRTPHFDKKAFLALPDSLGGRNRKYEAEKLTDIWHFSTATGMDGHGAQFPVALPARCIALSTREGDLVLDPFVGSGTTSVAAELLGRRSVGIDVSSHYLKVAQRRLLRAQRSKHSVSTSSRSRGSNSIVEDGESGAGAVSYAARENTLFPID